MGVEGSLGIGADAPLDKPNQFVKARHWFKHQWFVRGVLLLKYAFFHYGFRLVAEDGSQPDKLKKWELNNRRMYRRYAREAWQEWLVQENVVALWMNNGRPPVAYPLERCEYTDAFGGERLKIRHGLNTQQIDELDVPAKVKAVLKAKSEIVLTHHNGVFEFDVLKRERTGSGFGVPAVEPLFTVAAQLESLEVGDAQLAAAMRLVYEQHLMGYEIKTGIHAGSKANHWNKTRAQGFEKSIKGKTGHVKITTNFDHKINIGAGRPDPKQFEGTRYDAGIQRIAVWAMPLGQMLLGRSLNPFLMPMLKVQALAEREYVGEHLAEVFVNALGAPAGTKVAWSNRVFSDPRVAADLLKTGLQAGPLSQGTFIEEAGYEIQTERERKEEEGALPKKQVEPIYDMHHGPPSKLKGKPGGAKDES